MLIRKACLSDAEAIAEIYKFDLGYETDVDLINDRIRNLSNQEKKSLWQNLIMRLSA